MYICKIDQNPSYGSEDNAWKRSCPEADTDADAEAIHTKNNMSPYPSSLGDIIYNKLPVAATVIRFVFVNYIFVDAPSMLSLLVSCGIIRCVISVLATIVTKYMFWYDVSKSAEPQ